MVVDLDPPRGTDVLDVEITQQGRNLAFVEFEFGLWIAFTHVGFVSTHVITVIVGVTVVPQVTCFAESRHCFKSKFNKAK